MPNLLNRICSLRSALCVALVLAIASPVLAADPRRIGAATASFGSATVDGKKIDIGTPVYEGSVVSTGATDAASVLLDSKVVVKLDANTTVSITETGGTHVDLKRGTVQVYLSKRDGAANAGAVALSDPDSTIEALGTVFIASNNGNGGYYATLESTRPQGVKIKGKTDAAFSDLAPGKQAAVRGRKLQGIGALDPKQLADLVPNIRKLEGIQRKADGAFGRRQAAAVDALKFAAPGGFKIASGERIIVADQSNAIAASTVFKSVSSLTKRGVFTSSGSTGGGGGTSSGGLSDIAVTLDTGNIFRFNLYDSGIEDGDRVDLRVTGSGQTYLNRPNVTLANAGEIFSPTVKPNSVVTITFTALNEGSSSPNTGGLQVLSEVTSGSTSQIYNINTGQTARLRVKTK